MYMAKVCTGKKTKKDLITRLEKTLSAKRRTLKALEREHQGLQFQHQLLVSFCDSLAWQRQQRLLPLLEAVAAGERVDLATDVERELLQELQQLPYSAPRPEDLLPTDSLSSSSCDDGAAVGGLAAAVQPIAPVGDPLCVMRKLLQQPPHPGADTMTLPEVCAHFGSVVRELSMHMLQFEIRCCSGGCVSTSAPSLGSAAAEAAASMQQIERTMDQYLHLMATLAATRGDLITALQLTNCETGEKHEAPSFERHAWVLGELGLTREQWRRLGQALAVFRRIVSPVLDELRQLQLQSEVADAAAEGEGAAPLAHGERLQLEQQRSQRLKTLLMKDFWLRTCIASVFYGTLSYLQCAKAHCLMYPRHPIPYMFLQVIAAEEQGRRHA